MENSTEGTYIFLDGPNFSESARENFRVDVRKLRGYIEKKYPPISRSLWYDLEPTLNSSDF